MDKLARELPINNNKPAALAVKKSLAFGLKLWLL